MNDEDRTAIVEMLAADPTQGDLIKGTGGLRKLRIPLEGRGKRGGGRVIYWYHSEAFPIALLWVFAKNEASDLTPDQAGALAKVAAEILSDIGGQQ